MPTSSKNASRPARRTTQPPRGPSRWYPQRKDFESYQAWDTHYRAFQRIYELQDQVAALARTMQASIEAGKQTANPIATSNQSSASHILGIAVKAGVPKDGQVLTYKGLQGQFVFQ